MGRAAGAVRDGGPVEERIASTAEAGLDAGAERGHVGPALRLIFDQGHHLSLIHILIISQNTVLFRYYEQN